MRNNTKEDQYFVCHTAGTGVKHCVVVGPGLYCNTGQKMMQIYPTRLDARAVHGDKAFEETELDIAEIKPIDTGRNPTG